ncbi:hypothetical protein ACFFV7_19525 [Nonomuraea spiralis]|uniref:Uncharacterized protein n=1 Tax=Nonomuraea spiralis TaxID=46182 RepID=A0ABV5IGA8_9ACTN|nr:hypothetical protein [Nonomuraea spiralis]GGS72535.1 hypothetical protein GCM10010176_014550 [Nonomuraea spiralis]
MSNGARHGLGVVAGLLLPPLIAACLMYGIGEISLTMATRFTVSWLGLGVVAVAGAGLAFLAGSRLSPIASLLGGLAFTALGVVPAVEMNAGFRVIPDGLVTGSLFTGLQTVMYSGVLLFLGVALLVVSFFPSRWRSRERPSVYTSDYGATGSPYLPPGMSQDVTRPMHRE